MCVAILNILVGSSLKTGIWYPLLAFWIGMFAFYLPHWQEYFAHYLELGYFNGPTEIEVLSILMFTATGIFGPDVWQTPIHISSYSISIVDLFIYCGVIAAVLTILSTLYTGLDLAVNKRNVAAETALSQLIPLVIAFLAGFGWVINSGPLYEENPQIFLLTMNMVLSYLVVNCIIQRICALPYKFFYLPLIPLLLASANTIIGRQFWGIGLIDETIVLYVTFAFYLLMFVHFCISIADGFCSQLKIKFWTIPYPNKGTKKL